ncbi:hypothetical protein DAPPUDRAFT_246941 [Daphnia pulex]|uniref:Uncharacterized protein n=1 Tax=Daphnia pulex TaxID=6669 RepID=E9GRH3_DAPPU|nr:hypothetical protein DAPPUDRAFT_246941 [Daphnia pulex]|eukprot:EFX77773.1 hypothetical protein DAPPUDRAFT_246941 [Daphnia pulex]
MPSGYVGWVGGSFPNFCRGERIEQFEHLAISNLALRSPQSPSLPSSLRHPRHAKPLSGICRLVTRSAVTLPSDGQMKSIKEVNQHKSGK